MQYRSLLPLAMTALAVQACAPKAPLENAGPPRLIYSIDTQGGAPVCKISPNTIDPAKPATVVMTVRNDGGWCGMPATAPGRQPFAFGLLDTRPMHGKVYIHTVGYYTRVDYTPDAGYQGADHFSVTLEKPGTTQVAVNVTVTPGRTNIRPAVTAPKPTKSKHSTRRVTHHHHTVSKKKTQ